MIIDVQQVKLGEVKDGRSSVLIERRSASETPKSPFSVHTKRSNNKLWLIAQNRVDADEVNWSRDKGSEYVRVPLFAYELQNRPGIILHLGLQIGAIATQLAQTQLDKPAERLLLVYGTILRDKVHDKFQCWIGFAVECEGG